jgi:hypothetical protein
MPTDAIQPAARTVSRRLIAALFTLAVLALFTLSGGVLWVLGVNYDGLTGSMAAKIHPATYLVLLTFGLLIAARRNPAAFVALFVTRYPGALVFLLATLSLGAYIVLDNRHGIAAIVDTYLLAIEVYVIACELDGGDLARIERLLHLFFACNAAFALIEYALDYRFFPYRFEGVPYEADRRSTAFLGHPLENAVMTGCYILALVGGGGASMPRWLRTPAVVLQLAALVPFGGRAALLLTCALLIGWLVVRSVEVVRGRRMSLLSVAAVATLTPVAAVALAAVALAGFFDVIVERFADDNGSALTRIEMFDVFNHLSVRDIILGGDYELLESLRRGRGLQTGVENPIVRLVLYQGVAFTFILLVGLAALLIGLWRRLRPGAGMAFFFFLLVINSYESISNKSIMLAQFVVLMIAMFRAAPDAAAPSPSHRPATVALA